MKRNIRKNLFIATLIILLCFCFVSCGGGRTYDGCGEVYYYEPDNVFLASPAIEFNAKSTDLEYATLIFDSKLTTSKMNRFAKYCEELLNRIQPEEKLLYYISPKLYTSLDMAAYYNGFDKSAYNETAVYISYNGTIEQLELITYTLMAITPSLCSLNYGIVYGMSVLVESELGWKGEIYRTESDTINYITSNPHILDMEYPLFLSQYAGEEEISYVKSASCHFTNYIKNTYGYAAFDILISLNEQSLFDPDIANVNVSRDEYNSALNGYKSSWFNSLTLQIAYEYSPDFYYTVNARQYPVKVESNWMTYYISYDYEETYFLFPYNYDYLGLKNFLTVNEEEMVAVRDLIGYSSRPLYTG